MTDKSVVTLLLHGALGGILGGLLWLGFLFLYESPSRMAFFVRAVFYIAPLTAILGLLIGGVVWAIHLVSGRNLGFALRGISGIFISIFVWGLFLWIRGEFEADTLTDIFVYLTIFGVVVGTASGIVAGPQILVNPISGGNGSLTGDA